VPQGELLDVLIKEIDDLAAAREAEGTTTETAAATT
jgi:hypothetical protein